MATPNFYIARWRSVFFEIRAISHDHQEQQETIAAQQKEGRDQLATILESHRKGTEKILSDNQDRFEATLQKFDVVLSSSSTTNALSSRNLKTVSAALDQITGAGTIPYLFPLTDKGAIIFAPRSAGKSILTGVSATIRNVGGTDKTFEIHDIGNLGPQIMSAKPITFRRNVEKFQGIRKYLINITAQAVSVEQEVQFRWSPNGQLQSRYRVMKLEIGDKIGQDDAHIRRILVLTRDKWVTY